MRDTPTKILILGCPKYANVLGTRNISGALLCSQRYGTEKTKIIIATDNDNIGDYSYRWVQQISPSCPGIWTELEEADYVIVCENPKKYEHILDLAFQDGKTIFDTNPCDKEITDFYQKKMVFVRLANDRMPKIFLHCNSNGLLASIIKTYSKVIQQKVEHRIENRRFVVSGHGLEEVEIYKSAIIHTGLVPLDVYYSHKGFTNADLQDKDVVVLDNGNLTTKSRLSLKKDFPIAYSLFSTIVQDLPEQFLFLSNYKTSMQFGTILPTHLFGCDLDKPYKKFFNVTEEIVFGFLMSSRIKGHYLNRNGEIYENINELSGTNNVVSYATNKHTGLCSIEDFFEMDCSFTMILALFESVKDLKSGYTDICYYNETKMDSPVFSASDVNTAKLFNNQLTLSSQMNDFLERINNF